MNSHNTNSLLQSGSLIMNEFLSAYNERLLIVNIVPWSQIYFHSVCITSSSCIMNSQNMNILL